MASSKNFKVFIELIIFILIILLIAKCVPAEKNVFVTLLNNYALRKFDNKEYAQAVKFFNIAVWLRPDAYQVYENMSICYEHMGNNKKALEFAKKAAVMGKDDEHAVKSLKTFQDTMINDIAVKAKQCIIDKNYEQALIYLNEIEKVQPQTWEIYYLKGIVFLRTGQKQQAIRFFKKAVEKNQKDARTYVLIGDIYFSRGDYKNAIPYYKNAVKFPIKNKAKVLHSLCLAYNRINRHGDALDYVEKALNLDPNNLTFKYTYASVVRDMGDYKEALELFKELRREWPENGMLVIDIMGIHKKFGMNEHAREDARDAIPLLKDMIAESGNNTFYYDALEKAYLILDKKGLAEITAEEKEQMLQKQISNNDRY